MAKTRIVQKTRLCLTLLAGIFAACYARAGAGFALQFDGVTNYVMVTNNAAQNAFPITVSGWFRTTNPVYSIQSIASKYVDATGNGWFLMVQNGKLRGYYSRTPSNTGMDITTAGIVADGYWHHAAMVVDTNGGRLYLDGILQGSNTWISTAGASTSADPLYIGRYSNTTNRFQGELDEVTVWNRALGTSEVNYLKHRQLNGNEDGLLALYHFDEGSGTNAHDSTTNGFTGLLVNNPIWTNSSAPIVFNQVSGDGLKFAGTGDFVAVPHTNALNAFPLTAMAWIRTSSSNTIQGVLSKYVDASDIGYSMFIENGHLRAWYFKDAANYVWDHSLGLDGGFVTDGNWHHVALIVDTNGGRLYVDGTQTATMNWTGTPGATGTTNQFQIGKYSTLAGSFLGMIDEASVWNVALTPTQLAAFKNAALVGTESGLVAAWRFSEGSSTIAHDLTANGFNGALINNPAWLGSTAFLGDGTSAIQSTLGALQWTRQFAVATMPADAGFAATTPFWVRRLDDFGAPGGNTSVQATLSYSLQSSNLAAAIPLTTNSAQFNLSLPPYAAAIPEASAGGIITTPTIVVQPQGGNQLASVSDRFQLGVAENYTVNSGPPVNADAVSLPYVPLLDFDGNLYFGPVQTTFSSIANAPARGAPDSGGVDTILTVNNNSGIVVNSPSHYYGFNQPLNVILKDNGDAIATAPTSVLLNSPTPDIDCIQNICYARTNITLNSTGASAGITVIFPTGFSLSYSPAARVTSGAIAVGFEPLNANFQPTNDITFVASEWDATSLWAIEEMEPFWMQTPSITWHVNAGQITFPISGIQFVRQSEDDTLAGTSPLQDPNTAHRISNDGYFRNAGVVSTSGLVVPDANGVALLTTSIALNPPELRPHFPYTSNAPGAQIPTTSGGQLIISNGLIDLVYSSLAVSGPLPISYSTDCSDTNCSGAAAGPATLPFTPNGNAPLQFTVDGGLISYGTVPDTSLTWGYNGTQYSETAGDIQAGAFVMAGTCLRAEQSAYVGDVRLEVLLYSGFGDATNAMYVERPGQANYALGFANYPGLNFRTPPHGRSFLTGADTGEYPLASNSKYYVRAGGVSGVHQAAPLSSPLSMTLYGYPFTFSTYAVSYLDSDNYDSRTDGELVLPQPSGFTQEFARMKFLCAGGLDSAQLPSTSDVKHLVYWNVDITPQSIQFAPQTNETCSTAQRFLVLGVQTQLPFIPQAFHATLGFKTNGNLVTAADAVEGVNSRFAVPGQLNLQSSGTSLYPLTAASDGYFNNWENPSRPPNGFFTFAGKVRTPFFGEIKVQVVVTPQQGGGNLPVVALAGGWPAPDGNGQDMGWSVNGSNFFNMTTFDPQQYGYPLAAGSVSNYTDSSTELYRARAQKNWIDVAQFDYPLLWDPVLRQFQGYADALVTLPVIDVNSRLKRLSPSIVDFDFSEDLSVQFPALKTLDFANDALNEINGPLTSVSNALRQVFGDALNETGLTSGFQSLQKTVNEDASGFFKPILQPALQGVVNNLYSQLASSASNSAGSTQTFLASIPIIIGQFTNQLASAIQDINGVASQSNSVFGQINSALNDVDDTLGLFDRILSKDTNGDRQVIQIVVSKFVNDEAPLLNFATDLSDNVLNGALQDADPTLDEIQQDLDDVKSQFDELRGDITNGTGTFSDSLNAITAQGGQLETFLQQAATDLSNTLAQVTTPSLDYLSSNPDAAKQAISDSLITSFLGSAIPGSYQNTFRGFLSDNNFLLDQLMDTLSDQIDQVIKEDLDDQLAGQSSLFSALKGAGMMSQSLLSAKITGQPTFEGDSLRKIHLNAAMKMMMPDEMNFNAFMEIDELTSESVGASCIPPGGPSAEVTLGVTHFPLQWGGVDPEQQGQQLFLDASARWTLQGGSVLGIGGTLEITGGASFEGCGLDDIGASFAIGEVESYLAAKAKATVAIGPVPVNFQAGFFAGHACSLDPLIFADSDVTNALPNATTFTGVYYQYGGSLSLSQLLLGEADCVLDVEANISTQSWLDGGPRSVSIGFRQKEGLDVSLLCCLSGSAEFTMAAIGSITPDGPQLDVLGSAEFCGSVGPCPACISGCKTFTIDGELNKHGIDIHFDY